MHFNLFNTYGPCSLPVEIILIRFQILFQIIFLFQIFNSCLIIILYVYIYIYIYIYIYLYIVCLDIPKTLLYKLLSNSLQLDQIE